MVNNTHFQAWKFGGNNRFVTAWFLSLIKDGNDNSFPQIHLHNASAFFEDLTGKYFSNLAYKLHFLHTDLPTLHKRACFPTTILPLSIYLECCATQCVLKKYTTQRFSTKRVLQLSTKQLYQRINRCILVTNIFTCMLYFWKLYTGCPLTKI